MDRSESVRAVDEPSVASSLPRKQPTPLRSADPLPTEDLDLARRLAAGDHQALATLYDRWAPLVYGLAKRMLGNADEAEEVLEETFWQAWNQAQRYAGQRGSLAAWLCMIGRSRALDRLRARSRSREAAWPGDASGEPVAEPSPGPLLMAEHAQRKAMVESALQRLPSEQREAICLAYFGGLSQSEIAARTGQPLGTIKTRVRLGLHKLREYLLVLSDGGE